MERVKKRSEYTYRCRVCSLENFHTRLPEVAPGGITSAAGVPVTKIGNYGHNATPTPTTNDITVYVATSISFVAASGDSPAYLSDDLYRFADKNFKPGWSITVETESGVNDGSYTIASMGVTRGALKLTADAAITSYLYIDGQYVEIAGEKVIIGESVGLTPEPASAAGQVTIIKNSYKPNVTTGCSFCGSLNSR